MLAAVACEIDETIIRAGPDRARLHGRFNHREDRVVVFNARVVLSDRPARRDLLRPVVARQIGTDHLPTLPFVVRLEQHIGRRVERARRRLVVRRKEDRKIPLEAIFEINRRVAHRIIRIGRHVAQLARVMIVARNQAAIRSSEDDL